MRSLLMILAALLLLPAGLTHAQSGYAARVTQVDTSAYPQVTVYVSVTDADGRPVSGLRAADFRLTEDGQPVELTGVAGGGGGPISAVLVIDRSNSMREAGKMAGAQAAAHAFVAQMRPGDRTALLAFDGAGAQLLRRFDDDRAALDAVIDAIGFGGGTAIYDALISGVELLQNAPGRRVLLLLTDGQDCRDLNNRICPASHGSRAALDDAIGYAQRAGQQVHVVGVGARGGGDRDGIDEAVLRRIADETGGSYFYTPDAADLAALYTRLAGDVQREYRLTYRSPRPFFDGTRRDIQVQVAGGAASGAYVERHLIDVRSNPWVGALLLLPILGLLLLPSLARWRRSPAPAEAPAAPVTDRLTPVAAPARCRACDAELIAGARFCDQCGADQAGAACAACGRNLRPTARFCPACGAPVAGSGQTVKHADGQNDAHCGLTV